MTESIRDIMTPNPRSVESSVSIVDARRIMRDEDIAIRVVAEGRKEDGTLVGVVAQAEIAKHASDEQSGDLVEDISK
jgi:CBS domain-containing protein